MQYSEVVTILGDLSYAGVIIFIVSMIYCRSQWHMIGSFNAE